MKKLSLLLLALGLCLPLSACSHGAAFEGERTADDNTFVLDYTALNSTQAHKLDLEAGERLDAEIDIQAGRLEITVGMDGCDPIYKGKNMPSSSFQIEVEDSGTYQIIVTGVNASGRVAFARHAA